MIGVHGAEIDSEYDFYDRITVRSAILLKVKVQCMLNKSLEDLKENYKDF